MTPLRCVTVLAALAVVTACTGAIQQSEGVPTGAAGIPTGVAGAATDGRTADGGKTAAATTGTGRADDVTFDAGVTEEACPNAANPGNGCIYLGTISNLSVGADAATAERITRAQAAFWDRVNADGGIDGFDVDVRRYTRDNRNRPGVHRRRYAEIRDHVLALAQTSGAATTAAILDDLVADEMIAAPTTWSSRWLFEDVIAESGNSVCVEAMNAVDYAMFLGDEVDAVTAIHFADDYGRDAAAGARAAAVRHGTAFAAITTQPGAGNQSGAVAEVAARDPDLVVIATSPAETRSIVAGAAARGFGGRMITVGPGWEDALLDGPDAAAIRSLLVAARPWRAFSHGTVGHGAMRAALGDVEPHDDYISGWVFSYPLYAALQAAVDTGDLTRRGLLAAVTSLRSVDYEGMLPPPAGAFGADTPAGQAVQRTVFRTGDPDVSTGATLEEDVYEEDFFNGLTVRNHDFDRPCFEDRPVQ